MGNSIQCSLEDDQDDDVDPYNNVWGAILTSLVIYGALGLVLLIVFECKRSKRAVYASRSRHQSVRMPAELPEGGCCRWLLPLVRAANVPNDELCAMVGLDGFVVLRFLRLCLRVSFFAMLWGLVILFPIYGTSGKSVDSSFGALTMDHLHLQSGRLWVSAVSSVLLTGMSCYLVDCDWDAFVPQRVKYLSQGDPDVPGGLQQMYTARVECLPKELRTDYSLREYLSVLFGEQLHATSMNLHATSELTKKVDAAEVACEKLEAFSALQDKFYEEAKHMHDANDDGDTAAGSGAGCCVSKKTEAPALVEPKATTFRCCPGYPPVDDRDVVDSPGMFSTEVWAVTHFERRLGILNAEIADERARILRESTLIEDKARDKASATAVRRWQTLPHQDPPSDDESTTSDGSIKSSSAFITFESQNAHSDALQVVLSNQRSHAVIYPAPDPRGIIWTNVSTSDRWIDRRRALTSLAVIFFAIFLFIPLLVFCNVFGDLDRLSKVPGLSFLGGLEEGTFAYDIITSQVPALLQTAIVGLLPAVFEAVALYVERVKLVSVVEREVLDRGFGYQLVNLYFTLIGNSLASTMKNIVDEPGCIFQLLGASVPAVAGYFIQMVLINSLFGLTMELSRVVPLIKVWWFERNEAKSGTSERARARLFDNPNGGVATYSSSLVMPGCLLVIVLEMTYAVIVPFFSIASILYFAIANGVYSFNLLYVVSPTHESGGLLFAPLYSMLLTGLNFANATMVGYMVIKQGAVQAVVVLALIPAVEVFRCHVKSTHLPRIQVLSREAAVACDRAADAASHGVKPSVAFDEELYRQPIFRLQPVTPMGSGNQTEARENVPAPVGDEEGPRSPLLVGDDSAVEKDSS